LTRDLNQTMRTIPYDTLLCRAHGRYRHLKIGIHQKEARLAKVGRPQALDSDTKEVKVYYGYYVQF
jgi:hypothetical protein